MFLVGLINNIGIGIIVAYSATLASNHDQNYNFAMFTVFLQAVPILAVAFNAYFLIQIDHTLRLFGICLCLILSYMFLACAVMLQDSPVSLPFALLSCCIQNFARCVGEATINGYIKAVPQELIIPFSSGTGASSFFTSVSILLFLEFGVDQSSCMLFLSLLIFPYYACFMWIDHQRLACKQFQNCFIMEKNNPSLDKRAGTGEIEVIGFSPQQHTDEKARASAGSYDSDHEAYNKENPLPSDEKRYVQWMKMNASQASSAKKAELRRIGPQDNLTFKKHHKSIHFEIGSGSPDQEGRMAVSMLRQNRLIDSRPSSTDPEMAQIALDVKQDMGKTGKLPQKEKLSINLPHFGNSLSPDLIKNAYPEESEASSVSQNQAPNRDQILKYFEEIAAAPFPQDRLTVKAPRLENNPMIGRLSKLFTHRNIIEADLSAFKYEAKDNRRMQQVAIARVFGKTGNFIFNLGFVNFFEFLVVNLLIVVFCFNQENILLRESEDGRLSFLDANLYTIYTFAYYLGSFLSLSSIQSLTLMHPLLPTIFQCLNVVLWILNLQYEVVSNFNIIFVWCMWVGVHSGTSYTNFIFLASTKTNLECDMRLNYYERELVVNLLLISNMLGQFVAVFVGFAVMMFRYPELLFNPPA